MNGSLHWLAWFTFDCASCGQWWAREATPIDTDRPFVDECICPACGESENIEWRHLIRQVAA